MHPNSSNLVDYPQDKIQDVIDTALLPFAIKGVVLSETEIAFEHSDVGISARLGDWMVTLPPPPNYATPFPGLTNSIAAMEMSRDLQIAATVAMVLNGVLPWTPAQAVQS